MITIWKRYITVVWRSPFMNAKFNGISKKSKLVHILRKFRGIDKGFRDGPFRNSPVHNAPSVPIPTRGLLLLRDSCSYPHIVHIIFISVLGWRVTKFCELKKVFYHVCLRFLKYVHFATVKSNTPVGNCANKSREGIRSLVT